MSRSWIRTGTALCAIFAFAVALSPAGGPGYQRVLEFAPLIAVAPDEDQATVATAAACTTPAPTIQSAFIHCYRPADIYAAYRVDAVHQAGITGAGQTIVIVDSYGSPTALHDLQFFSSTFGLPQPDLTIIYPDGAPPFNNSVNGAQVNWAFETSLDVQWAHAIAPDAKIVLIAPVPA